jgi:hypothetical protein
MLRVFCTDWDLATHWRSSVFDRSHFRSCDDGRTVVKTPLGDTVIAAFGFPHYQSHRADVLAMLINAFPAERLHIDHRLVDFVDRGDHVEAAFANGEHLNKMLLSALTEFTQRSGNCCSVPQVRTLLVVWPIEDSCQQSASC